MRPALVLNSPKRSTPDSSANCTNSCASRSPCRFSSNSSAIGNVLVFKLTSLNLNGLRSAASKGVADWVAELGPDCICMQEIRVQASDVVGRFERMADLEGYFHYAQKKGYAGTAIYTRHAPSAVVQGWGDAEFDAEGRYLELRFDTPGASSRSSAAISRAAHRARRGRQAKFRFLERFFPHLVALKKEREFILCGDINIAHQQIDLKNWRGNQKNSGFLPEERAWMTRLLHTGAEGAGLVDVYRHLKPDTTSDAYTWWSNRGQAYANNVGLAAGLSPGHAGHRGTGAHRDDLQDAQVQRPCAGHDRLRIDAVAR